ncbi:MAG: hypothetical protein QF645_10030, partial [Planctomycetota bacterium]|nr:hypothetical protein [Planctomycetota bacterium]
MAVYHGIAGCGGSACPTGTVICNVPIGVGKATGAQAVGTGAFRAVGAMTAGTGALIATGIMVG